MRRTAASIVLLSATASMSAEPVQTFGGAFDITDGAAGFNVDVNGDGRFDVNFAYYGVSVNSIFGWDGVVGRAAFASDARFASELDEFDRIIQTRFNPGAQIGPAVDSGFSSAAVAYESYFDGTDGGPRLDMEPGFVGFSFLDTDGGRHYAWAEVEIDNEDDPGFGRLILTRIAYETVAGVPIAAGDAGGAPPCNAADLAEPRGVLDLADITVFVNAFLGQEPPADLDENGLYDLGDITAFVNAFVGGCP